eukprot:scaffold37812_cov183-Amphora_coffeaeformis.AAC.2
MEDTSMASSEEFIEDVISEPSSEDDSSLGEISDPDDVSSLESLRGSFEFLQQQKLFRRLEAIRRNSPTEASLDLNNFYISSDARDWDPDELDKLYDPPTIAVLRQRYDATSFGRPTTLDRLGHTFRDGGAMLTELALKESVMTRFFPIPLTAKLMEFIASSASLQTFKFFGALVEPRNDAIIPGLFQALVANDSIQSLEIRRVAFDEHSFPRLLTKRSSTLRHLELVDCMFHDVSDDSLTDSFAQNVGLTSLQWQNNTSTRVESLLRGIEQHAELKDFSLSSKDVQGQLLGEYLARCPALESFYFHRPLYNDSGKDYFDSGAFFRNLEKSKSIRKVALRIGGTYSSLSRAPPFDASPLEEIDISMCEWPRASCKFLFAHLPKSRSIDLSSSTFRPVLRAGNADKVMPPDAWSQLFNYGRGDSLEKLNLHNCGLRSTDLRIIATLLGQKHVKLKELNVSFNRFGTQDLEFLVGALEHSPSLEILCLCGPIEPIDVDDRTTEIHGFALVARLLRNALKLCSIDLTDTTLFVGEYTDDEEQQFVNALQNHEQLESITIDGCWLSPRQCRTFFMGLRGSKTLKSVSARYHNFALLLEDTDINFADMLEDNSSLTHLDLEQSTQSAASVASLCRGIGGHQKLRSVHLGKVDCHDAFSGQLCEMLRQNQSLNSLSMRLSKWSLTEMEVLYRELFVSLPDFHGLRELNTNDGFSGHSVFRSNGEILLQSLRKNTSLESISVSLAFLPYVLQDKIQFYLRLNKLGRRHLLVSDQMLRDTSSWPLLFAKMKGCRDVRHLHYFVHELGSTGLLTPG